MKISCSSIDVGACEWDERDLEAKITIQIRTSRRRLVNIFGGLCSGYLSHGVSPELSCTTFSSSLLKEKNGQIAFDCSSSSEGSALDLALCHTETFLALVKYMIRWRTIGWSWKVQG